jgi:hypothetical protein
MNNRIRWYLNILRMNKGKIPKEISNMKPKGKYQRERLRLKWEYS